MNIRNINYLLFGLLMLGCQVVRSSEPVSKQRTSEQQGMASWYGGVFHGKVTASGERFDQEALTAAHRSLPFGTVVRVKHRKNGRSVVVRINDRGPFKPGRIIDLSKAAARKLNMLDEGKAPVVLYVIKKPSGRGV